MQVLQFQQQDHQLEQLMMIKQITPVLLLRVE